MSNTRSHRSEYSSWYAANQRCHNSACKDFKWYGARGIAVCDRWRKSFADFHADMGDKPRPGMTLDRIDGSRGYEPGNCRWATMATQRRNQARNKLEPHEPDQIRWLRQLGYQQREIAQFFGIDSSHVSRITRGLGWVSEGAQ